jgi:hypothetical protein
MHGTWDPSSPAPASCCCRRTSTPALSSVCFQPCYKKCYEVASQMGSLTHCMSNEGGQGEVSMVCHRPDSRPPGCCCRRDWLSEQEALLWAVQKWCQEIRHSLRTPVWSTSTATHSPGACGQRQSQFCGILAFLDTTCLHSSLPLPHSI